MERTIVLRVLTRCSTVDQFVETFRRLSTDTSVFVPTRNQREVGVETAFSIRLAAGAIVLSGLGSIAARFETSDNVFGKPGILVDIRRLTAESQVVFDRMRAPLDPTEPIPEVVAPATTNKIAASGAELADMVRPTVQMPPLFSEERAPGSPIIVPANPLAEGAGAISIDAFIDGAMCECDDSHDPHEPALDESSTSPLPPRPDRSGIATTLGFAPLSPATTVASPFVVDTPIPRWPRASLPATDHSQSSVAALVLEATSAPVERPDASASASAPGPHGSGSHERTAMVALDRASGEPQPGPWASFRARLAKTVRGVRWWLRKRRTTDRIRA